MSGTVRVSLGLPTHRVELGDEFTSIDAITAMARAAEDAGFDAVYVTDHPFPSTKWMDAGGHHTLDPMIALAVAATATTSLRLQTNLFVAAYRNPFIAAKAVATLDALSGGRVILGLAAGYLQDEFAALGVDFEERNDLLDESIAAMKLAWTGERVEWAGRHFTAPGNVMLPIPAQRPHPPIWIGGNSQRAIRRAVEFGDGWVPMPSPARAAKHLRTPGIESIEDLRRRLDYAWEHAAAVGRQAPLEVVFMPAGLDGFHSGGIDPAAAIDSIAALADAGVTYITVSLPDASRREFLAGIQRYGDHVLQNSS